MKKPIVVVAAFVLASFMGSQVCFAQLIDYNRRNRNARQNTVPQPAPAAPVAPAAPAAPAASSVPAAAQEQAMQALSDTKAVLKNAVARVNKIGSIKVNSDILKKYDKNNDGMISKAEAKAIKADIR